MSLWVDVPEVVECHSGTVALAFSIKLWDLLHAEWRSESVVALRLRKFPGDHLPPFVETAIDLATRTAIIGSAHYDLDRLEPALDALLQPRPRA
jgi:hypothetical protein